MPAVEPMTNQKAMPPTLLLHFEEISGALVVQVIGQIGTPIEADRLERALARACLQRPRLIVIDLSHMTAISSQGFSAVLRWQQLIRARVAPMRLAAPQPHIDDLLRRTGMIDIFEVHATLELALAN
jgi:anti-anti-sigma factor